MTQFAILTSNTLGVYSFTTGFIRSPIPKMKTETDILAHALWLERQGATEEAWLFLSQYCDKK